MEDKKDKRKLVFAIFAAIVIGITGLNIYLNNKVESGADVDKLKEKNTELLGENIEMKQKLSSLAPSNQESDRQAYIDVVNKFMKVTLYQDKNNYEERKSQAKGLMGEELFDVFFSSKTFPYEDDYKSSLDDASIYLQSYRPMESEVDAIVEYTSSLVYNGKTEPEKTHNVIKLKLENQAGKWIVTSVDEILMEML